MSIGISNDEKIEMHVCHEGGEITDTPLKLNVITLGMDP